MASVCWGLDIKGLNRKKDKTPDIDIVVWLRHEVSGLPNDVDGVKIFRPNTIGEDGRISVDGNVELPAKNNRTVSLLHIFMPVTILGMLIELKLWTMTQRVFQCIAKYVRVNIRML